MKIRGVHIMKRILYIFISFCIIFSYKVKGAEDLAAINIFDKMEILKIQKDLGTYELLYREINKMSNELQREALLRELDILGKELIYTENTVAAIDGINLAWQNRLDISELEKLVVNKLAYENSRTMYYLQATLNELKYNKTKDKKQILILGDSITLAMGTVYVDGEPQTHIEDAWWQYIDKKKYNVNFLGVGGLGLLSKPESTGKNALEMLEFIIENTKMPRSFDKIIIALGTNDFRWTKEEYVEALDKYIVYLKENFNTEEIIFLDLFYHQEEMKRVAEKYKSPFVDIDMNKVMYFDSNIDNIHPSSEGHKNIYEQFNIKDL
jgi:lysophospholipase L1-like esterase